MQSRYYDPSVGRFISADTIDVLGVSPTEITDKNLFSYCDNNPVSRKDATGDVWETVFDVASLGVSIVEVAINPTDVWAWAGLVGDAVDLIPFVTGVGEVARGIKLLNKSDEVIDAAKSIKRSVNNASGTYEILYKSGKNYVGKGNFDRAINSAIEHAKPNRLNNNMGDVVTSIKWRQSKNSTMAFMEEYALQTQRGVNNSMTYNLIWSPGRKYYSRGLF